MQYQSEKPKPSLIPTVEASLSIEGFTNFGKLLIDHGVLNTDCVYSSMQTLKQYSIRGRRNSSPRGNGAQRKPKSRNSRNSKAVSKKSQKKVNPLTKEQKIGLDKLKNMHSALVKLGKQAGLEPTVFDQLDTGKQPKLTRTKFITLLHGKIGTENQIVEKFSKHLDELRTNTEVASLADSLRLSGKTVTDPLRTASIQTMTKSLSPEERKLSRAFFPSFTYLPKERWVVQPKPKKAKAQKKQGESKTKSQTEPAEERQNPSEPGEPGPSTESGAKVSVQNAPDGETNNSQEKTLANSELPTHAHNSGGGPKSSVKGGKPRSSGGGKKNPSQATRKVNSSKKSGRSPGNANPKEESKDQEDSDNSNSN